MKKLVIRKGNKSEIKNMTSKEKTSLEKHSIEANIDNRPYDLKRKGAFSVLDGDGMDAMRKEIAAIRAGQPETSDYKTYREKIDAIKKEFK